MTRSLKPSSTHGRLTGSKSTKSGSSKRSAATSTQSSGSSSSRVSISYGTDGNIPTRQDATDMYNLALSRFTDSDHGPFFVAGSLDLNANPTADVYDRYAGRDMVGQLQSMSAPLTSWTGGPNPDVSTSNTGDEGYNAFLSLWDDEEAAQQAPASRR